MSFHAHKRLSDRVWKKPGNYAGFSPDGDALICTKARDSDPLVLSNFRVAIRRLGNVDDLAARKEHSSKHDDRGPVYIWRASCSMFGWYEYLMIRADAPDSLKAEAESILAELANYPCLDEDDWAELSDEMGYNDEEEEQEA